MMVLVVVALGLTLR